jgi:hypothetical protein
LGSIRRALAASFAALAAAGCGAAPSPLGDSERAVFLGSPEDPPTDELDSAIAAEGESHVHGNEWSLELFYPSLRGLGGGYLGIGADQAYLFLGWQRPELAWLIDYDARVVDVHRLHQALLLEADSPEAFLALWQPEARERVAESLARTGADAATQARLREVHAQHAGAIRERLVRVRDGMREHGVPSYLEDAESYAFVRGLLRAGRVRAMCANLLDTRGMQGIGDAARRLGVPIRVFYVSNVEQYWDYSSQYRSNVAALPFDSRSVLARTLLSRARDRDRYVIQPAQGYADWLSRPWVERVGQIVPRAPRDERGPRFLLVERDAETAEREGLAGRGR